MTKFHIRSAFRPEVEQELAFLEAEGFAGPAFDQSWPDSAVYASSELAIEIGYVGDVSHRSRRRSGPTIESSAPI